MTTITTYQGYREMNKVMQNTTATEKQRLAEIFHRYLRGLIAEGMVLYLEEQAAEQAEQEARRQTATASETAQRVMLQQAYRSKTGILQRRMFEIDGEA